LGRFLNTFNTVPMNVALFQLPTRALSFCLFCWSCGLMSAAPQPLKTTGQAASVTPRNVGIDIIDIG